MHGAQFDPKELMWLQEKTGATRSRRGQTMPQAVGPEDVREGTSWGELSSQGEEDFQRLHK